MPLEQQEFLGIDCDPKGAGADVRGNPQPAYFDIPTLFLWDRDNPYRAGHYLATSADARAYRQYGCGVAQIHVVDAGGETSDGSGFFVDPDGLLLTDLHIVNERRSGDAISVTTTDGVVHSARVVKEDSAHDLALLQVDRRYANETFKALKLASSSAAGVNEHVTALGFPEESTILHISPGTYKSRFQLNKLHLTRGYMQGEQQDRIITTAEMAVMKGNSGGPVINSQGEVVGVVDLRNEKSPVVVSTPVEDLTALVRRARSSDKVKPASTSAEPAAPGTAGNETQFDLETIWRYAREQRAKPKGR